MMKMAFYCPTKVVMHRGCVTEDLAAWQFLGTGLKKALLVTGRQGARRCGAYDDVVAALTKLGIGHCCFDEVEENPSLEVCYAGAEFGRREGVDCVVAIGGGSAMDAAKVMARLVRQPVAEADFFKVAVMNDFLPIAAIPTTSGTGSEVTPYAIITDPQQGMKRNVVHPAQFPKVTFLDAHYLASLPWQVLADTAMDALSHAIEGFYSPRVDALAEALALEAIGHVAPALKVLAAGGKPDLDALLYGANVAGIVIAQAGTGLVHAMGYSLTCYKGVPHGRANGLLLAAYMDFMQRKESPVGDRTGRTARLLAAGGWTDIEALRETMDALVGEKCTVAPEELERFVRYPLQLELIVKYRVMPSRDDVMDIYQDSL